LKKSGFFGRFFGNNHAHDEFNRPEMNPEQRAMIKGVLSLSEVTVKEVMVPRIDVNFIGLDFARPELIQKVSDAGHSRFPVYKNTIDNVVGMLYAKDLLRFLLNNEEIDVEKIIRRPFFVPESKRLDSLLREMQRRHVHIAVAVDEYGGVSGIVCLEDIIEEIVGDIQDEFDNEREDILEISDKVYLCDARVDIEDLNEQLGTAIPDQDFDTLGGFVFDLFGKIPTRYEKVTYNNTDFIIQEMDGHKITTVKIVSAKEGNSVPPTDRV
jgi:magnesium and cobalt transporter